MDCLGSILGRCAVLDLLGAYCLPVGELVPIFFEVGGDCLAAPAGGGRDRLGVGGAPVGGVAGELTAKRAAFGL